eukprot:10271917-Karenia_brevis.AAC.1
MAWKPWQFFEAARACRHPFDEPGQIRTEVAQAVFFAITHGPNAVARRRRNTLDYYKGRAECL